MLKLNRITALLLAGIFLIIACGGDEPTEPVDTVGVWGTVGAYICTPDDPANDAINPLYSIETGREATVLFSRYDDTTAPEIMVKTNEMSTFSARLPEGTWRVRVLTDHAYLTTVDSLVLTTDTTVEYAVQYQFRDPDTLVVVFQYELGLPGPMDDSDGPSESEYIAALNETCGNLLKAAETRHWSDQMRVGFDSLLISQYAIPLIDGANPWMFIKAMGTYRFGGVIHGFPDYMTCYFRPMTVLCPGDFYIIDDSLWLDSGWVVFDPPDSTGRP